MIKARGLLQTLHQYFFLFNILFQSKQTKQKKKSSPNIQTEIMLCFAIRSYILLVKNCNYQKEMIYIFIFRQW